MSETKTVLGRVFTHSLIWRGSWSCKLNSGHVLTLFEWSTEPSDKRFCAELYDDKRDLEIAAAHGPTETDAILALQSTLRKMAELEVTT